MCFDMAALVGCQDECFGVEVGEFDAGVDGEGVVGHVEGDLRCKDSKFCNFNKLKKLSSDFKRAHLDDLL